MDFFGVFIITIGLIIIISIVGSIVFGSILLLINYMVKKQGG